MTASEKKLVKSINVSYYYISKYNKIQVTVKPVVSYILSANSTRNASKGTANGGTYTIKNVSQITWKSAN